MNYCTQRDLVDRFGETELLQLTDPANVTTINSDVVEAAIADACAEIDGYLESRYALPLTVVPAALTTYACDMARYRLYDDHATERVSDAFDEAIKWLLMVAKGDISLGIDVTGQAAPTAGGPQAASASRIFTSDTLKDFQ